MDITTKFDLNEEVWFLLREYSSKVCESCNNIVLNSKLSIYCGTIRQINTEAKSWSRGITITYSLDSTKGCQDGVLEENIFSQKYHTFEEVQAVVDSLQ